MKTALSTSFALGVATAALGAQYQPSQGNIYVHTRSATAPNSATGINAHGTTTVLHVASIPDTPLLIGLAPENRTVYVPGLGYLYLSGPILVNGWLFDRTNATGTYFKPLTIPMDRATRGVKSYFQVLADAKTGPILSNGVSIVIAGNETIWKDGFENGLSNWIKWANGGAIDSGLAHSGKSSLRCEGRKDGCWGGGYAHDIGVAQDFYVEFWAYVADLGGKGCHTHKLWAALNSTPTSAGPTRQLVLFNRRTQKITSDSIPGLSKPFALKKWTRIQMKYERINATQVRVTNWVDGSPGVSAITSVLSNGKEEKLRYLVFEAGDGPVWIDGVVIYR